MEVNKLHHHIWLCKKDGDSYVRASALSCLNHVCLSQKLLTSLLSTIQLSEVSLKSLPHNPEFIISIGKRLENIVGKGENAGHQHFLLFPQCLLPNQRHKLPFDPHLYFRLRVLTVCWSINLHRLVKSL